MTLTNYEWAGSVNEHFPQERMHKKRLFIDFFLFA